MSKTWNFDTSRGAGIPGLPHVVTEDWLKQNPDMKKVFEAAVKNGAYKEKAAPKPKAAPKEKE